MGLFAPSEPAIVDAIMIGEMIIAILLIVAFAFARKHKGVHHHYIMLSAFLLDELIFKPLMTMRAIDGSNGNFPWEGTAILPHLILSIAMTILGIVTIFLGFKRVVKKDRKMFMPPKGKIHRIVGRTFILTWIASYMIGLWVFVVTWG